MRYYIKHESSGYYRIYKKYWWFLPKCYWTLASNREEALELIERDKTSGEWI